MKVVDIIKRYKDLNLIILSDLVVKVLALLFFPIVAKYLLPKDFGLITNYFLFISIVSVFINLSHTNYFQVQYFQTSDKLNLIKNTLISFIFNFIIIILFFLIFGDQLIIKYFALKANLIYLAILTSFTQVIFDFLLTYFRVLNKSMSFFLHSIFNSLLNIIVLVVLIHYGLLNGINRIYATSFTIILCGIFSLILFIRVIDINYLYHKLAIKKFKDLYKFGFFLLPHNLGVWVKFGIEKIVISNNYGIIENGYYSFAFTFSSIFLLSFSIFTNAISPIIYSKIQHLDLELDIGKFKKIVGYCYLILIIYLLVLIIGYFVLTYFIVPRFFPEYKMSLKFLPFLLTYNFFNACYLIVSIFVFYSKNVKYFGLVSFSVTLVQVFLTFYFNKIWGEFGILWSSLLSVFLLFLSTYFYSRKVYKMPWFF